MRLITQRTVEAFASEHADARQALANWMAMIKAAHWTTADELVQSSTTPARAIPNNRVVFKIKGNKYRVVVSVRYAARGTEFHGIVMVQFIGTHAEYDKIDATIVTFTP